MRPNNWVIVVCLLFVCILSVAGQADRDDEVVIACLLLEAGGEGETGMQAVMNVIDTRAKHNFRVWYNVVTKPKQFSCFNAGVDKGVERAKKQFAQQWNVAQNIVQKAKMGNLPDITGKADHYHSTSVKPGWASTMTKTVKIGNHVFYRSK